MGFDRSDIKLSFYKDDVKFFVNEKKGIVSCVITADLLVPFSWRSHLSLNGKFITGRAVAQCHEVDTFDVERGKRIALAKAENDAYRQAGEYLNEYVTEMNLMTKQIVDFFDKKDAHKKHNLDYIESIHDPEHPMYKEIVSIIKNGTTNGKPNYVEAKA